MKMAEAELYNRCCRLCLSDKTDTLKSVFGETEMNDELREKILVFLSVDIKINDRLSTMICELCLIKINDWNNFKKVCHSNQTTIEGWANRMQDIHNMSIQIKEEVIDQDISMQDDEIEIVNSNFNRVKAEPIDYDSCNENTSQSSRISLNKCRWCDAEFEDKEAHNDHEKKEHGIMAQGPVEEMETNIPKLADPNYTEKVEFAAGLRLIQSNSTPITMEPLSRIEMSYIEKCKAMVGMYRTLICACHNAPHPNLKGLLSHLRGLRIWFPVFTCYHCMITFTDRSSSGKHHHKCPKKDLDTLVKLSNLKKRSALKTRLYQNYKCVKCRFMFSFHDDFCKHVDEHHVEGNPPYFCTCKQSFDRVEDYKDHIYVSCMVEYYCDICFVCMKNLKEFIQHAEENHDNSEGFVLLQDDNYKQRSYSKVEPRENKEILGKRRSSTYGRAPPVLKPEVMDYEVEENGGTKVVNSRNLPTKCPQCDKVYSCQANMLRHYRTHVKTANEEQTMTNGNNTTDNSLYQCPDCQVMFNAKDWEEHKDSHDQKKCLECNKVFLFQSELELHRSVHLNLKVYRDAKTHSYKTTMLSPNSETPVCDICGILCENFDDLESHKLCHEDLEDNGESDPSTAKYSCMPCNKHYTGYSGLWEHNKKKHSDKQTTNHTYPRQCDECEKVITSGSAFASHKQMHRRVREETARMASDPNSPDEAPTRGRARKSGTQDDEDYFTCKRCFKVFSSKYNLRMHMKLHGINMISNKTNKQTKKISCDVCNIQFPNTDALRIHNEEEHDDMPDLVSVIEEFTNKPYIFTCDICVQTFSTKEALKQHKENHASEGGTSKQFTNTVATYCKYCKIPFDTVQLLDEHMLVEHEELPKPSKVSKQTASKNYACKICRKTFVSQPAMYAHQGWHKRLKNESLLKATNMKKQNKPAKQEKPQFVCSTCHLELPNDTALRVHTLEKHENMAAYLSPRCETCNQEFATISEYENHKKLHEIVEFQKKLVTYPCQYCSASFNKNETLQTHIRLSHTEIFQEFKCGHCGRVFDKQASLTNHVKVHEKQKTVVGTPKPLYFCSICNMGFHIPNELRAHTITAHPF